MEGNEKTSDDLLDEPAKNEESKNCSTNDRTIPIIMEVELRSTFDTNID